MKFLIAALLLCMGCGGPRLIRDLRPAAEKIDPGLTDEAKTYPIFVRMADQLFRRGGDYDVFTVERGRDKRRELRKEILATLRGKSDRSWDLILPRVNTLTLKSLTRFWIVNGFACDATLKDCRTLAEDPAVSYVYLQRGPDGIRQHHATEARALSDAQSQKVRGVLDMLATSEPAFSSEGLEIPWNLEQIQAPQVWKEGVTGEGVVVAVADSGMILAPSLVRALWKNPEEGLNGKDDDGNGIIDDLFGADFASGSGYVLDDAAVPHGSACAGIIAGRPIAAKPFVTGVAPRARIMMLRGMGYLKSYEYAVEKGADVLSMSYMWVNVELGHYRGLFRTAHEHMAAAGIVALGGAGNFAQSAPAGKQITLPKDIPCVLAVAGVARNGSQPAFSSRGPCSWKGVEFYDDCPELIKPDLCTFNSGFPCWSTPACAKARNLKEVWMSEDGTYGLYNGLQGNSFAGPHAAGVVALMLHANPDLNAWEVKEILESTCKDLGDPGRDIAYGAGLVQALEAVRAAISSR